MHRWLTNQRGFTLGELLVVTAVTGLVMAGVFVIQKQGQEAYLFGSNRVETQQNARVALDLMTRELRPAISIVTLGSATDLTFKTCADLPPVPVPCVNVKTIRYQLSGTTLNRTEDSTTTPFMGGVTSLTMTYYAVYDVYSNTYTTTTNAPLVKLIKVSLVTKTEEGAAAGSAGDQHATMESTVNLRATLF